MKPGLVLSLAVLLGAACQAPDYDRAEALVDQVSQDIARPEGGEIMAFAPHARGFGPGFRHLLRIQRIIAAVLPPSTVNTAPVEARERISASAARATSAALTSRFRRLPRI